MRNKLIVVVGLAIGLFLTATLLQAQPFRRPGWLGPWLGPGLQQWLGLTSEQKSKIEALRKTHQEEMKALRDKLMDLQKQLREARQDPKADPKKIEGLIDEIFKIRASQMKARLRHQSEIEKILTKEQKEKLDQARQRRRHLFLGPAIRPGIGPWRRALFFPGRPGFMRPYPLLPRCWR